MNETYRREYLIRLPLPLAQLYNRASIDYSPRSHHNNTYYLFEAFLRLGVAVEIAAYRQAIRGGAPPDPDLARKLGKLRLPSVGDWRDLLRDLARHFDRLPDAATHPLGHLAKQLQQSRKDLPAVLQLYCRIKNGVDRAPANNQSCSLQELFDALVTYRNDVFGHGSERFEEFYDRDMGPLLFPAVTEILAEGVLDLLGPPSSRLVYLDEVRTLPDGQRELRLYELTGLSGMPCPPIVVPPGPEADPRPGRVGVLWPGRTLPVFLDPLLKALWDKESAEVLFLNSDHKGKHVKYLSYRSGETSMDAVNVEELAELLAAVAGDAARPVTTAQPEPARGLRQEYEPLGEIGRGGMGVVYLARQLSLGRLVALKTLLPERAGDKRVLARFRNEIKALARCEHPNIVRVLDTMALLDGQVYYSMEYVPGCDLERVWQELKVEDAANAASATQLGATTLMQAARSATLRLREQTQRRQVQDAPVPLAESPELPPPLPLPPLPELPSASSDAGGYVHYLVQLMHDAAEALQAVHDKGIVHRDIKPENLMLTADGRRIVLMDFGLAKGGSLASGTSESGGLMGTLRYAAPEQLAAGKQKVGPAADVRGLGVTFWELLTRRRLFGEAQDEMELTQQIQRQNVPLLREIDPKFHPDLETILARATERHPADRIPTAGKLAEYLQLYLDRKPLPIRQRTRVERLRGWVRDHANFLATAATAAALAVLTTVLIVRLMTPPPSPDPGSKPNPILQRAEKLEQEGLQKLLQPNELPTALLYLTEALKLDAFDPEHTALDRLRIGSILRQCPRPVEAWSHEGPINSVEFSPDGQFVVTASDDKTARVWKVDTGEPLFKEPLRHDDRVRFATFSPNGRWIVTASFDKTARVWNAATGKLTDTLRHDMPLHHAAFSPDGTRLATASGYGAPHVVTVQKEIPVDGRFQTVHETQTVFEEEGKPPADRQERSGEARVWTLTPGGEATERFNFRHIAKVRKVLFTPDGRRLLTAGGAPPRRIGLTVPGAPPAPAGATLVPSPPIYDSDNPKRSTPKPAKENVGENVVKVWNLATGERVPIADLKERNGTVFHLAFGTDRKLQITVGPNSWLVDMDTGVSPGGPGRIDNSRWVSWSPDGRRLIAGVETSAELWDTQALFPVRPAFGPIRDDDRALALRGDDPILLAQMAPRRSKSKELEHGRGITVTHGLFSPDGRRVATAGEDRTVRLWDAANGRAIVSPFPHPADIRHIAFSPDGRYLSVVMADHRTWLWDCAVGLPASRRLRLEQKPQGWQTHPRFSRDTRRLTALLRAEPESGGRLSILVPAVWDTPTGDLVQPGITEGRPIQAAFSSDGAYLATADTNGKVMVQDLTKRQQVRSRTYPGQVVYLAFSDEGRHLLSVIERSAGPMNEGGARDDKPVAHVWEWNTEDSRSVPLVGPRWLVLSPDGSRLAIASDQTALEIRDVATGRSIELQPPPSQGEVGLVAFSGDSRVLLAVVKDKTARLWDLRNGELLNKDNPIAHGEAIFEVKFSKDNRYVLTTSARRLRPGERPTPENRGEGEVRVWEAATGRAVSGVMKHAGPVYHAAFSADGRWVVSACDNAEFFRHEARLWEVASGTPLTPLLTAPGNCSDMALSPDGHRLLTVSMERNVHEWPLDAFAGSALEVSSAAEVLSGRRIDSSDTARELEASNWKDTWKTLRDKNTPFLRRASEAEVKAWHLEALHYCHREKQWRVAALHLQYLITHGEDTSERRHEQALALLLAGDESAYRRACQESWQRFRNSRQADDLSQIVRTWLVKPVPKDHQDELVRLARNAVELRQGNPFCTQHHVLGAALYRAGKYDEAIRELQTAEGLCGRRPYPWDLLFLALAYHQQGNKKEAQGAWNKFIGRMSQDKAAGGWLLKLDPMESMELEILRREGENLGLAAMPKT